MYGFREKSVSLTHFRMHWQQCWSN